MQILLIDTNEMGKKMEHAERERGRTKLYMQANDGVMVA